MLYDTLVGDLTRAIAAMRAGNIEERCAQLKHGFQVLQQLDGLLDMKNGGSTAQQLHVFHAHLRREMLAAQFKLEISILERQIGYVLEVRQAWQQIDSPEHAGGIEFSEQIGISAFSCTV